MVLLLLIVPVMLAISLCVATVLHVFLALSFFLQLVVLSSFFWLRCPIVDGWMGAVGGCRTNSFFVLIFRREKRDLMKC